MIPRTYTVALALGAVMSRTAPMEPRRARTTAALLIDNREEWARMRDGVSRARGLPAQLRPRSPVRYITQMAPLSRVIATSEPDNGRRIGRGENLQAASGVWRGDAPNGTRRNLLAVVHRDRRRVPPPRKNRVRDPPQPDRERVPGDRLSGESEGDEHPRHSRVPECPGDS